MDEVGACALDPGQSTNRGRNRVLHSARTTRRYTRDARNCRGDQPLHNGQRSSLRQAQLTRVFAAALAFSLPACSADPVRATVDRLYEATTPPMGWASTLIYAREPTSVNASWEVESSMPWDQYAESTRSRIASEGFTPIAAQQSEASFRRELEGDVQILELRLVSNPTSTRVAVTFTSRPF
jgi:hypothetical protein